ncbi:MAG TPA: alanine racemase, partial [Dongiaceae bacterium]|nr:alanine racemase [Dongiaceae bacterium]
MPAGSAEIDFGDTVDSAAALRQVRRQLRAVTEGQMYDQNAAILTIDLHAIAANYRLLQQQVGRAVCAAAVKADGYGLGAIQVAPALYQAGCRNFFVATLDEGLVLRRVVGRDARICILNGLAPDNVDMMLRVGLTPVLNGPRDVEIWAGWNWAAAAGPPPPAVLQLDTGMSRLGFGRQDWTRLLATDFLERFPLSLIISHLGCADDAGSAMNRQQRGVFQARLAEIRHRVSSDVKCSLAASSGIFLGPDYHFDLVRPGAALYGINPTPGVPNRLHPVLRLQGKILQVHDVDAGTLVGYGATHKCAHPTRIATIGCGYADGLFRALSSQ